LDILLWIGVLDNLAGIIATRHWLNIAPDYQKYLFYQIITLVHRKYRSYGTWGACLERRGYIDCVPMERVLCDEYPKLEIKHKPSQILVRKGFSCQNSG
jgi:hypothetical protein